MVFASDIFILFMAVLLPLYALCVSRWREGGKTILILASLFFYSYWLPTYVFLLLASIAGNFLLGRALIRETRPLQRRTLLSFGLITNLLLIAYFKYADFFLANIASAIGLQHSALDIALPLGISFFTFQQISFLVEIYRRQLTEVRFKDYALFIAFFPQLIAGPIVTQSQMLPQLRRKRDWRLRSDHFALGFFLFSAGLFKKVVLIDPYVPYIDVVFAHAAAGNPVGFLDAWTGALGYTFQIYLDFSGYSDMAIGLALIFGLKLPMNFFSPYKAASIREFWRRWHITLSRFLQRYLYIPFGGSKQGTSRTVLALMGTMLLGGLWHGAGWQFIVWGGLHGAMLVVNHIWGAWREKNRFFSVISRSWLYQAFMVLLTFTALTVTWVFFRADSVTSAVNIVTGMFGVNDAASIGSTTKGIFPAFPVYMAFVWLLPNMVQIMRRFPVALVESQFSIFMRKNQRWAICFRLNWFWMVTSLVLFFASWFSMSNLSPFIYFQF
jgi:D-alanyl-lipoteichoic acid acyltransferase DltB (MBOAT superfamily)